METANPSTIEKKQRVLRVMKNNIYGCDLLLCLFISALNSYKAEKCLRPFPPMFVNNTEKEIDRLKELCNSIPSLYSIMENTQFFTEELFDLLTWLFCIGGHSVLQKVHLNNVNIPFKIAKPFQPHYVFEIIYPAKAEELWKKRKNNTNSFLAYHGSAVQNFYSILRVGLLQHFSETKELLYGKGIYLTNEIAISIQYAPFGMTWPKSGLGSKHSIIALCEVIDNKEKVKTKGRVSMVNNNESSKDVSDKYFVVTDTDIVRPKYLFVYKESAPLHFWTFNKLCIVLFVTYLLIICCNGYFQGSTWNKLRKQFYRWCPDIL